MTITFRTTHDERATAPSSQVTVSDAADGRTRRGLRRFVRRSGDSLRLRIDLCLADVTVARSLDTPWTEVATSDLPSDAHDELAPSYWNECVSA